MLNPNPNPALIPVPVPTPAPPNALCEHAHMNTPIPIPVGLPRSEVQGLLVTGFQSSHGRLFHFQNLKFVQYPILHAQDNDV